MRRLSTALFLAAALAAAGVATAGPTGLKAITTNDASVAVKVTPRMLEGAVWEFEVAFDTHTQELKDDLLKSATLVAADGSPVPPLEWKGAPPGGHHRSGVLRFAAPSPAPGMVELRINRAGETKPRTYNWNRPPASASAPTK